MQLIDCLGTQVQLHLLPGRKPNSCRLDHILEGGIRVRTMFVVLSFMFIIVTIGTVTGVVLLMI